MFKLCGVCGDFISNKRRKTYCSNSCYKKAKRDNKKNFTKTITKFPENGRTLDVVDMMKRNTERFNYGLELNR